MASQKKMVVLGKGFDLPDVDIVVTDPYVTPDGMSTLYKVKNNGFEMFLQFGTGPTFTRDERIECKLLTVSAGHRNDKLFVVTIGEENSLLHRNLLELLNEIGSKLYDSRDVYFKGQCKKNLSFEEFMECASSFIRKDTLTGESQIFLKTRKTTKLYKATYNEEERKLTRGHLPDPVSASVMFTGILSCNVGVHVSMNKGQPKWGIYLTVLDAYLSYDDERSKKKISTRPTIDIQLEIEDEEGLQEQQEAEEQDSKKEVDVGQYDVQTPPLKKRKTAKFNPAQY